MGDVVSVEFKKARRTAEELRKDEAEASLCGFKRVIEVTAFTMSQCFGQVAAVAFLEELVGVMKKGADRGA